MDGQTTETRRTIDEPTGGTRNDRGGEHAGPVRVSLEDVLQGAAGAARSRIEAQGHELVVSVPPNGRLEVVGDRERLSRVITDLLNMAAERMPGRGRIHLQTHREPATVLVQVRGSAERPAAWSVSNGESSRVRHAREVLAEHGGSVAVQEEASGHGGVFLVRLPLPPESPDGGEPGERTAEPAVPAPASPRRRILVVDDNQDSADSLALLLSLGGHEVQAVYDGYDAVDRIERFRPDVVLLDLGLPRCDGFETCRRIRSLPGGSGITLVALTGWARDEDRQRTLAAGFQAHLIKPVDLDQLTRVLDSHATRPGLSA